VVVLLCWAAGSAAIIGFLMSRLHPIKLVVLVGIVALVSAWSMVRSLFAGRAEEKDPGRTLAEAEAPRPVATLREWRARGYAPVQTCSSRRAPRFGVSSEAACGRN